MATSINTKFGALALGRGPLVKNQPLAQGKAAQAQQPNNGQDAVKLSLSSANIRGVASGGGNSGQSYVGIRNALTQPNGSRQPGLSQGQASALKGKPGLSEPGSSGLFREGATISGKISELDLTPNSSGALEFNLKDGNENYNVSVQGNVGFAKNEATGEISTFRVALSGDSYTFSDVKNLAPSTSSTSEAYKGVESGNGSVDFGGFSLQFGEGGQIQFSLNNDQLGSLTGQGYYDESQGVFVLSFSNGATLSGSLERAEGGGFTLSNVAGLNPEGDAVAKGVGAVATNPANNPNASDPFGSDGTLSVKLSDLKFEADPSGGFIRFSGAGLTDGYVSGNTGFARIAATGELVQFSIGRGEEELTFTRADKKVNEGEGDDGRSGRASQLKGERTESGSIRFEDPETGSAFELSRTEDGRISLSIPGLSSDQANSLFGEGVISEDGRALLQFSNGARAEFTLGKDADGNEVIQGLRYF